MNDALNQNIAEKLEEYADLLEQQQAKIFRINAYRRAAGTLRSLQIGVDTIFECEGNAGLIRLPGIGEGISHAIIELLETGQWSKLERLRGTLDPEKLFQTVPGIGPELAKHIHDELHVDTLPALEVAAHDGRLERVSGVGPRRAHAVRAELHTMLSRIRGKRFHHLPEPSVDIILSVDREYRVKAREGSLKLIAPKRFNPFKKAWLPILHTTRGSWHFTVLHSNTELAHRLGRTHDWVVVYFNDNNHREGQLTVVTERKGTLNGKRIVRGREIECEEFYNSLAGEQKKVAV